MFDFTVSSQKNLNKYQGSILCTTLFILKINTIIHCLSYDIVDFLYVDDFVMCFQSRSVNTAERKLQLVLNKLSNWADQNGLHFLHLYNQRKLHPDPSLFLNNHPLPVVK